MENKYTYDVALAELQEIVTNIESGDINVDELSNSISRASTLIAVCKAKLTKTQDEVEKLLAKLHTEDAAEEAEEPESLKTREEE